MGVASRGSIIEKMRTLLLLCLLPIAGCGYHRVGGVMNTHTSVRSLAVPIFQSRVQAFRTETVFTAAVVRELNTRTAYRVDAAVHEGKESNDDATLNGTILTESIAPLTYDPASGQTSSYLVSISAQVVMTARDGTVLYRNDAFAWREQYQSTQDLSGFVQEDSAAVRRVAHDFAQALVSGMLESFR